MEAVEISIYSIINEKLEELELEFNDVVIELVGDDTIKITPLF